MSGRRVTGRNAPLAVLLCAWAWSLPPTGMWPLLLQQLLLSHVWPFSPSCWTPTAVTARCYMGTSGLWLLASHLLSDGASGS